MALEGLEAVLAKFSISDEQLLGAGGESRVYALNDDLVLRVYHGSAGGTIRERKALLSALPRDAVPFAIPEIVDDGRIGGSAYTVERRLGGRSLGAVLANLDGDSRENAWRNYLDAAAAIARLKIDGNDFGETVGWGGTPLRTQSWTGFLLACMDRGLQDRRDALSRDVTGFDVAFDRIRRRVMALGEPAERALVHGDFHPHNVMVDEDGRVTGVIDFGGNTLIGDQRMDLASAVIYATASETPDVDARDTKFLMDEVCRRYGDGFFDVVEAYRGYYAIHFSGGARDYPLCVKTLRAVAA